MRQVTRRLVVALLVLVGLLLLLGALPQYLRAGDPYYLQAEPIDGGGADDANGTDGTEETNGDGPTTEANAATDGNATGGNAAGGNATGGNAAGGNAAGGNATGGNAAGGNATDAESAAGGTVPVATLSERAHPYTFEALRDADGDAAGRSSPYWRGPLGLKEAFTHSPFDEVDSYRQQYPEATDGDAVRVRYGNRTYRLTVIQP